MAAVTNRFAPGVATRQKPLRNCGVRSTVRHLEYARGYLELGLLTESEAELNAITAADHDTPDVLSLWLELHLAKKQWLPMLDIGRRLTELDPQQPPGWVLWAYALRELHQVETALAILLRGKALHGDKCAIIHYNLACYYCLLGDRPNARIALTTACRMDPSFKATALDDPDLASMRDEIAAME